jgi:hypothetical protein
MPALTTTAPVPPGPLPQGAIALAAVADETAEGGGMAYLRIADHGMVFTTRMSVQDLRTLALLCQQAAASITAHQVGGNVVSLFRGRPGQ